MFCKHVAGMCGAKESMLDHSDLSVQILDLMGYEPSHWNKVNIHIGGVYGDKETTLERWAQGFQHLSDNCKKRLTLENDDWVVGFSVKDLLPLSQLCNIPIVFDFHHHKFCSGELTCQIRQEYTRWPQVLYTIHSLVASPCLLGLKATHCSCFLNSGLSHALGS